MKVLDRLPNAPTLETAALLFGLLLYSAPAHAQSRLVPVPGNRVQAADQAVLANPERVRTLSCEVSPVDAEMDFDLQFHTGYEVRVPLKELKGDGGRLRVVAKVTPVAAPEKAVFLTDRIPVPPIGPKAGGEAQLSGEYVVGPGSYSVDWLMSAGRRRVCSAHWKIEAKSRHEYEQVPLGLPADTVSEAPRNPFRHQAPPARATDPSLYLKVLVNFSGGESPNLLTRADVNAITSILRSLAREPRFGRFSVVAFSADHEAVLYRQEAASGIDFPSLGTALGRLRTGTVDYHQLQNRNGATDFLGQLLTEEIGTPKAVPDAIVIVGPKVEIDKHVPRERLTEGGRAPCPVYYLNYDPNPYRYPWEDAIQVALKFYRGFHFSISRPRDLGKALAEMSSNLPAKQ